MKIQEYNERGLMFEINNNIIKRLRFYNTKLYRKLCFPLKRTTFKHTEKSSYTGIPPFDIRLNFS